MPVQLRVDDFLYTKLEEHHGGKHTVKNFMKFDQVIPKRYLLGVIPENCSDVPDRLFSEVQPTISVSDSSFINPNYANMKFEPAMHGIWHDESRKDEFPYMYPFQIIPLMEKVLQDGPHRQWPRGWNKPRVYMPPHNVVNLYTVKSCKVLGFEAITGGPETDERIPDVVRSLGMRYIPCEPPLEYGRSDELMERGAVEHLRRRHGEGDTVVLGLHWTWEHNIGIDSLKRLMDQIGDMVEDFVV